MVESVCLISNGRDGECVNGIENEGVCLGEISDEWTIE